MGKPARFTKVIPNLGNTEILRGELSDQLATLEHRLRQLQGGYTHKEISLCQTYREMIYGRRALLQQIKVA